MSGTSTAGFIVHCPKCRTPSDDPVKVFELRASALVPDSEYILWAWSCRSCELEFDVACWTPADFIEKAEAILKSNPQSDTSLPSLKRYQEAVSHFSTLIVQESMGADGKTIEDMGCLDADLEFLDLDNREFRKKPPVISMQALALPRGMRMALLRSPDRYFVCQVGWLKMMLGLEQIGDAFPNRLIHLSMSNQITEKPLTNPEANFAISLFFGQKEVVGIDAVPPKFHKGVQHIYVRLVS